MKVNKILMQKSGEIISDILGEEMKTKNTRNHRTQFCGIEI